MPRTHNALPAEIGGNHLGPEYALEAFTKERVDHTEAFAMRAANRRGEAEVREDRRPIPGQKPRAAQSVAS